MIPAISNNNTMSIYCDETCYIQNDHHKIMALGAIKCPKSEVKRINQDIKQIKIKHKLKNDFEIKWTKVSPGKIDFYENLIEYFFKENSLSFRIIIVPDKQALCHSNFNQSHDDFYYKLYYTLLIKMIECDKTYNIFLDIKDTRSAEKVELLRKYLCSAKFDFSNQLIPILQTVRSHEVQILQLADLLIGAMGYLHRGLSSSTAKTKLVNKLQQKTNAKLLGTSYLTQTKFNVLVWRPKHD